MNNENNEGIIIEGGVEVGNYSIPTMDNYLINIRINKLSTHKGIIKVARISTPNKSFRNPDYYDVFYYYKDEVRRKDSGKTSKTRFTKKEIKQIEDFYMRNIDTINMNTDIVKEEERIDDEELYNRIYQTELSYYKNGGR